MAQAESLVDSSGAGPLPTARLDIVRLADANVADPSNEKISGKWNRSPRIYCGDYHNLLK